MKLLMNFAYTPTSEQEARLREIWPGLELRLENLAPERLDGADVEVLVSELVPRDLAAWPKLRWVQLPSAGSNQILGHPIQATDIAVTTASGTHAVPIAQYVTCTCLMMAHRMEQLLQFKPSRTWPNRPALAGRPLRGQTAGIIGYGSIGRECARQLAALGLRIVCLKHDPANRRATGYNAWPETGDPEGRIPSQWYGPGQLPELLAESDWVVVTVPSTPRTQGLIDTAQFSAFKPGARLIIISRGGIVSEPALAAALRDGRLAAAAVDCYVREPLPPDDPLFDVPNLLMTPHMSGVYDGFWPRFMDLVGENLRRYRAGLPLLNATRRHLGY
ncbi:MAG TPA: D-2-hydroxyacid dehydrogenase [Opitutaceae bacterium]|nr:D-2-hydroxyacid dehydrogenase [Opitutaceae bacterium]HND60700.1 D-2-hydroxyacid dehydrogenase [Opitutaceae bacterium]